MLPPSLVSLYQQYKQDTDAVASWLASTAKACGKAEDLLASRLKEQKPVGRLKGKARKEAKKAGVQKPAPKTDESKYIIAISDFVPLAKHIVASRKPVISVPESFSETLNRVIEVRSIFRPNIDKQGATRSASAAADQSDFVAVLEKVREVLRPRMSTTSSQPEVKLSVEEVTGRFAGLRFYEPSQGFLDAPDIKRPTNNAGDVAIYEAERHTSVQEATFAYIMMLNDLNKIRSSIEWIWINYLDGSFDLAAAAVATNTAIDLARRLTEDVVPLFKDHGGCWELANGFYLISAIQAGYPVESLQGLTKDAFNMETYEIANKMYIVAFILLRSFADSIHPRNVPVFKEGMFGTYNPTSDWNKKSPRAKFKEDKLLLMEQFGEFMTIIRAVPNYPVRDEFLRGMKELDQTGEIPFYLVFAAQIFLDIHHIMRDKTRNALEFAIKQINYVDNTIGVHLKFHKDLRIDNWPTSKDQILREIQRKVKWIEQDPTFALKERLHAQEEMDPPSAAMRHRMLQRSPVLAGLLLYYFRAELYNVGIGMANAWGSITYTNHLYNALKNERLLKNRWTDMDIVQSELTERNFFIGGVPKTRREYFTKFCLQIGTSMAAFSDEARHGFDLPEVRAGPNGIKDGIPISGMFMKWYLKGIEQVDWTPKQIDDVLFCAGFEVEGPGKEIALALGQIDDPEKLQEEKQGQDDDARRRRMAADGGKLTPENLIRPLVLALRAETVTMAFPFLTLHRFCWMLLRKINEQCGPLFHEVFNPGYIQHENQLPFILGYIFVAASGRLEGRPPDDRLLKKAAEVLQSMLKTGAGKISINEMKELGMNVDFEEEEEVQEVQEKVAQKAPKRKRKIVR